MRIRRVWRCVLGAMLLLPWIGPDGGALMRAAHAEAPPAGAKPFPLTRTGTVKGRGKMFYIDGAAVIPRTADIRVEQGVTIFGINHASLDVQGGLEVHGTEDTWVTIHKVDFSPTTKPLQSLHLDMVDFRGCTFKHDDTQSLGGKITIENSCLQRDCVFDVRLTGGFLKIMTVEFGMSCRVRSIRDKGNRTPIEFEVRSSWMKAIQFSGPAAAVFRHSEIRGGLTCEHVTQVEVDGCDVSETLSFAQEPTDSFKKIVLTKCNLYGGATVVCARAKGPKTKKERVRLQRFYFGPKKGPAILKKDEIAALVRDGADLEDGNVKVIWTKPKKRPHVLVNYDTLRDRAPDLR